MINYSFSFKKYFFFFFILFFSLSGAQKKFTVVLDAGHGDLIMVQTAITAKPAHFGKKM